MHGLPKGRKTHLTYDSAADLFLEKLKATGGRDYDNNERHIRLHLKPFFKAQRIDRISSFTIEGLRKHLRDKGLAEATVNLVLATHRRMSRRLVSWVPGTPQMPTASLTSVDNARDYVMTLEEEQRLLDAALNDQHPYAWLFIKVALTTGLRHTEILSLRFDALDVPRRRIRVKVKGGHERHQHLTRGILEIIEREQSMASDPEGWLFPGQHNNALTRMTKVVRRCVKRAKLDSRTITPHAFRHTALTRFAEADPNLRTFMAFSGHKSVTAAMRYIHARDHKVNEVLDRMEGRTILELPTRNRGQKF